MKHPFRLRLQTAGESVRVAFNEVFTQNPDGSITPRAPITVGGVTMGPGVTLGRGVSFGGVDLAALAGRPLEVDKTQDGFVIRGVY